VRCTRADGIGLDKLRARGIQLAVISTETNSVVQARARKLKLYCECGVADKRKAVEALAAALNVPLGQTAYLGNDINDLPALEIVGFPAVVADAHPDVRDRVARRTNESGGYGAVREFCDRVAEAYDEAKRQ
jgi:YrbI family 3-deoxy-D-manno-octulosonate 8-phosphate phosphatase